MKNDGTYGTIDSLTISYDGNQLLKVTDAAEALNYNGALDFHDGADATSEYTYDGNGALTKDSNRGIKEITYDYGHHPDYINMNQGKKSNSITNDYTSDGRKLSSLHRITISNANGIARKTTTDLYIDGLILRDGVPFMWQFDGGYVDLDANGAPTSWNYYITDHLGSTRKVVDSNNNVKETINYYPFGSEMRMEVPAQIQQADNNWHPFRFTGKELDKQNGLNMYDFGARLFDVAGVPMWTSVDPLAEKFYPYSPYNFCTGDPVNRFDPDGREVINKFDQNDPNVQKANKLYIDRVDDEDDAIIVFAHGIGEGNGISTPDKDEPIGSAYNFETFLDKNSEEWKNRYTSGKDLKIVLFSCETGAEDKFAQRISADPAFEGVKIIAPADDVTIRENGTASIDHNKPWIEYTNGKVTNTFSGRILPGTKEFERASSWDKTWNKYSSHK